ncbi:PVC-type heme-binding CxxCH protein [Dyadobacter sp. CY323]|uniref:PVC-type heme-binding CxxCH protein n=1 Tax=Dyadobacter sp. CY323 TaxID=2907302 RepID=UPI001F38F9C8|nr:PVC-type heme-binding CxxCH protein [Dyadobacter sp. CY323]MCE6991997.1 HEAT repeat domain-containing protein [Dyadobacter sp. CY323]
MKIRVFLIIAIGFAFALSPKQDSTSGPGADSLRLKKAMESFRLEEGLGIELVASEPLVIDPVAFAFDEQNDLYVVEDRGYPDPIDGSKAPAIGRIALLRDTDSDGKYETRREFVGDLTYPNGILPWKGGVFVTCAPHVYYFKDTDGDGVADIKDIVLTGFNSDKTAQIRISHPVLGLDGWVYITSGLNSGTVTSPKHPEREAVNFTSADGRFDPETFVFENAGGRSQFGLTFDPFGRRFGTSNRHPVMQMMIAPWDLKRNPSLLFTETYQNVSNVEANAKVMPISGAVTTAEFIPKLMGLSHTGTFTSACGLLVYNGNRMSNAHKGNVFICEPAQNLVQRQLMSPDGAGFRSELADQNKEFLASTDEWFRPVFLNHGPDGSLYLADMHRKVIDHPSYVPEEARHLLDFESGKSDGRLYRIYKKGQPANRQRPDFKNQADVLAALDSDNEWHRQTAFRVILQNKSAQYSPGLKTLAINSSKAESRAAALWLLSHLQTLDKNVLEKALRDPSSGVREQAVKLTDRNAMDAAVVSDLLAPLASDADKRVRFTAALALGNYKTQASLDALAKIAAMDGEDKWTRNAVLSGISERLPGFLTALKKQKGKNDRAYALVMQEMGRLFGNAASVQACRELLIETLDKNAAEDWRASTILGLAEGVARRKEFSSTGKPVLQALLEGTSGQSAVKQLEAFMKTMNAVALREDLPVPQRKDAVALLGFYDFQKARPTLQKTLNAKNPPELQIETVAALTRLANPQGAALLTDKKTWSGYTPRVKSAVIAALVSNTEFIQVVFTGLESKAIGAAEITSNDRQRLMSHKNEVISKKAAGYFAELESGGRMKVYQDFRAKLREPAVAAQGKEVFLKSCSACHTHSGLQGGNVGPDLSGIRNQPPDAILLHILVPNYEVYPAYQALNVETVEGNTVTGWLLSETENSLTIRTAFSTEETILRKNIKTLTNPGVSLMPNGLEQTMSGQELLNLIAFLKSSG